MTDADVNALFANYVKAKEMVGESAGPGSYGKLLKTINAQAPKIMQQYNAKGVDFDDRREGQPGHHSREAEDLILWRR